MLLDADELTRFLFFEFGSERIPRSLLRVSERILNNLIPKNRRFSAASRGELQFQ